MGPGSTFLAKGIARKNEAFHDKMQTGKEKWQDEATQSLEFRMVGRGWSWCSVNPLGVGPSCSK